MLSLFLFKQHCLSIRRYVYILLYHRNHYVLVLMQVLSLTVVWRDKKCICINLNYTCIFIHRTLIRIFYKLLIYFSPHFFFSKIQNSYNKIKISFKKNKIIFFPNNTPFKNTYWLPQNTERIRLFMLN